jgi:ABC-type branched-subunit amino acid transport system ATPase component
MSDLLSIHGVSRSFGGVRAVENVSLAANEAEVLGIIGPNGAGKTTLFNILSGTVRPDTGTIVFDGRQIAGMPSYRVAALGVARTFQHVRLFSSLSVVENLTAVSGWRGLSPLTLLRSSRSATLLADALSLLDVVGLRDEADRPVTQLPYGHRRRLEIARALALRPRLLLLDEPCAGLGHGEAAEIVAVVRQLRAQGLGVLLIEHNMSVVMGVADRIVVLDHGEVIAEGAPAAVAVDPRVVEAYLGAGAVA